jgi:hypothetical protein
MAARSGLRQAGPTRLVPSAALSSNPSSMRQALRLPGNHEPCGARSRALLPIQAAVRAATRVKLVEPVSGAVCFDGLI